MTSLFHPMKSFIKVSNSGHLDIKFPCVFFLLGFKTLGFEIIKPFLYATQLSTNLFSAYKNIQLMHSFEVNIRIWQPENSDDHRAEAEVNITF